MGGKNNTLGVLLPVFSLPSQQGIGCFGSTVYRWIDVLTTVGVTHWQVCPLGPTGYGCSPYQPLSEFALNPYFVDVSDLISRGWIPKSALDVFQSFSKTRVQYQRIKARLIPLLYQAYDRFLRTQNGCDRFEKFKKRERVWLDPYATFCALKDRFGGSPWWLWPKELRAYENEAVRDYKKSHVSATGFFAFVQWVLSEQWSAVKRYARRKGVHIVGDVPIYVGEDSVVVWEDRKLFQWNPTSDRPQYVAGVPPDYFSPTGQLWGNPLYDWSFLEKNNYRWWVERIKKNLEWFDFVRLDHFRGFYNYWAIPQCAVDARNGQWMQGPQHAFFDQLKKNFPKMPFILEDLGDLNEQVRAFQRTLDLPGMAVLQFAFDGDNNPYLPHKWTKSTVVYTGTHDNDTTRGWFNKASKQVQQTCLQLLKQYSISSNSKTVVLDLIRLAYQKATAKWVIIPLQDWLNKGSQARMNTPGTVGNKNWTWRCTEKDLADFQRQAEQIVNAK
ncbi:MAG: 4-alpha-glucanotransferase [Puniceicoccales bacterium]|jgi:4-alpha-glucanotransferase|nr:4-alpha-glucanotransferase [Puniceicoccales bacterium]